MATFKEAYKALCEGKAIKRASWLGYWIADGQNVLMHCKDGTVVSMKDGCIPMFTLGGTVEDDWMILDDAHRAEFDKIHAAKILAPAADQKKAEAILKEREEKATGMNETMLCCECKREINPDEAYTFVNGDVEDIICKECAKNRPGANVLKQS